MRPWRRCINVWIDSHGKRRSKMSAKVLKSDGDGGYKNTECVKFGGK